MQVIERQKMTNGSYKNEKREEKGKRKHDSSKL